MLSIIGFMEQENYWLMSEVDDNIVSYNNSSIDLKTVPHCIYRNMPLLDCRRLASIVKRSVHLTKWEREFYYSEML